MGRLMGPVAKKLQDSKLAMWFTRVVRLRDVDIELVWTMRVALFNVETRASPAQGSRIWMPASGAVGLKSNGGRARTHRAMPCAPSIIGRYFRYMKIFLSRV